MPIKSSAVPHNAKNPPIALPLLGIIRLQSLVFHSKLKLVGLLLDKPCSLLNLFVVQLLYHCVFPKEVRIGKNLCMPHPFGIILSPLCKIGDNVKIMQFVTIGINEHNSAPHGKLDIGDNVYLGAGSQIIGNNIKIADNAIVGAGAVVIYDVPEKSVVVGVPAKVIRKIG